MTKNKTMIELESGSGVMAETFKKEGYDVLTIDINPDLNPDICMNILDLTIKDIPKKFRNPDVVWAGVPCTTFSVASIYRYWDALGNPKSYKTYIGLAVVMKNIELIKELDPKYFFIENPRGMLRQQRFMEEFERKTISYCQYGDNVQKPTDIFCNVPQWVPKPMCSPGSSCHESAK
jgi:site-specific DNA-cytosine methylase